MKQVLVAGASGLVGRGAIRAFARDSDPEQIARNDAMLRNLFEPLSQAAKNLRHVTLLQGTKAYGAHVRALSVPAREDRDELKSQPNFYWNQEDYLRAKQQGAAWSFC